MKKALIACACLLGSTHLAAEPSQQSRQPQFLTATERSAIVVMRGSRSLGTGFIAKIRDVPFLVTNLHVIDGNSSFRAETLTGTTLSLGAVFGAIGHDVAIIRLDAVPDDIHLFEVQEELTEHASAGADVVIVGNSLGEGVLLETRGKVVGVGPFRIEHDAPAFKGNSGSPIILAETRKVVGVDTLSTPVNDADFFTRASLEDDRSAIRGKQRLFGYRLDSVQQWQGIDLRKFYSDWEMLGKFDEETRALWVFLTSGGEEFRNYRDLDRLWRNYEQEVSRRDLARAERESAANRFVNGLAGLASRGLSDLEANWKANRFYDFHSKRVDESIKARKQVLKEAEDLRVNFRRSTRLR